MNIWQGYSCNQPEAYDDNDAIINPDAKEIPNDEMDSNYNEDDNSHDLKRLRYGRF